MRNPSRVSSGAEASSSTPKIRLGNLVVSTLYVTLVPCLREASVEGSPREADYSQQLATSHFEFRSNWRGRPWNTPANRTHNCDSDHSPCCTPFGISKQCQMGGQNRI